MDISDSAQQKGTIKCKRHKGFSPSFILLNSESEEDVLICNQCIEKDEKYDKSVFQHYQAIEPLLKADDKTILAKWSPLKEQGILRKIQQHLNNEDVFLQNQKEKVVAYFDSLLSSVVKHIEDIKKQMLQKCSLLPELEEQLYQEYNKIAEKEKLKEVLMKSNSSYEEANNKMIEIIKQKEQEKEKNEELITTIFNSYLTNLKQFDQNAPTQQMNQIVKLIKTINFFPEYQIIKESVLNKENTILNQIVKAIENKTNFFSQEFTDEINTQLNEWSFIFNQCQIKQIYTEGHVESLNFEGLLEEQLKILENLVENMKINETNIELTPQVKLMTDLINNPTNYLTKEFSEQISLTMKQLSPFFNRLKVKEAHQKNKTPINFKRITQEQVELIHKLVDKMSELKYEINPKSIDKLLLPYSNFIREKIGTLPLLSDEITLIFQQYPICELIKANQKLQFIKGYYNTSQANTIQIQQIDGAQMNFTRINNSGWVNIMSNWFLEKQKTYQIVFEINYQNKSSFNYIIGISSNEKNNYAANDTLSFYTHSSGLEANSGMDKVKKGSRDNLKHQKQLQLNVNLSKGILEIGDYPNLNNIMEVDDNKNTKLQQDIFYQIVFSVHAQNDQLLIKNIKEINE